MCFNPIVSLSTAIIEWILAAILIVGLRKSKLVPLFSAVLILLGAYQFTEFMFCVTSNLIWIKIGFIAYTFLPVLGLHAVLRHFNRWRNVYLLYFVPVAYALFALLSPNFVMSGTCLRIFIFAKTLLSQSFTLFIIYCLYYTVFITAAFIVLSQEYCRTKNKNKKRVCSMIMIAILLMTLPTFFLIFLFPALGILFPSVFCHFALLLAVFVFIGVYLDAKKN